MNSTAAQAAAPSINDEVRKLRALVRQQQFTEVLATGLALLDAHPHQRDVLLFVAIAQRYTGRVAEALRTLELLERHHPRFSRLYEERGRCFVELRRAPEAIEAFVRALSLNYTLPGTLGMLEGLYRLTGQFERAAAVAAQAATLKRLPAEIVTAIGLFADGDLDIAEPIVRAYLLEHGNHAEAMRLLARIASARKVYDDAALLLEAVLDMAPNYGAARQEYAAALAELHRHEEARREIEGLLREDPQNRELRMLDAYNCVGLGEHERAIELYSALLTGTPDDAEVHLSIAHAQKTLGRPSEAIESYRRAADCRPQFGDAYWSLANLKTYRFTDAEISRLRLAQQTPAGEAADRYHLAVALAKALEDRGEFAESFRHYELGNALKRAESDYRSDIMERNARQQMELLTGEFFANRAGWGAPAPDPIFIIGLPRSGSTLLEQILASHTKVEGTYELANVAQMVRKLRGRDPDPDHPLYPAVLTRMSAEDFQRLGEKYLADTRVYRTHKPFFIDKMPNNFRHAGFIHLMLPNARIIDARREPMACCFSNLKQLFAQGQEFSYSIDDIARYYRDYLELMRHWDRVLPGRILRIQYEDVVGDLETHVRRLLDFCGLDFEPQCIEFHQTRRSVRTASSEQVRQALYRDGLDHWRHFEPWLGPLKAALGGAVEDYRG
jgi:tetratricopeptide (TPR) repeat protein